MRGAALFHLESMLDVQQERLTIRSISRSLLPIQERSQGETSRSNLLLRGHGVDTQWDEVKVEKPAISQQVLDKTFRDKVIGHSRGLIIEAQRKWSERQTCTVGQIPLNRSYLVSCQNF